MKSSKIKLRILYVTGTVSLVLGLVIYLLFRETSYVAVTVNYFIPLDTLREAFSFAECDFLKFWLADFMWAVSFASWLHIALQPDLKGSILCFAVASIVGIIFEFLQYIDVISGTADFMDVLAYIFASVLISIINLFLKE